MFWISFAAEALLMLWPGSQRVRFGLVAAALTSLGFWAGASVIESPNVYTFLLIGIGTFRAINLLKVTKASIHPNYLRQVTRRTSLSLLLSSLLIVLLQAAGVADNLHALLTPWALLQFVAAGSLLGFTVRNLHKTKHHQSQHYFSDKELPTVTVAIPARNETNDMAACLRTVLANDYPKLEVLVLDDCSQDRTAEVIRDFAQDGVRFIAGKPPKDRWLAKNQAYEELARHASGEVVLFCGVDVRFGPGAIRALVTSMLNKNKAMVSVMPFRIGGGVNTSLIQPLRYWWELALPRRTFNRPSVLSTCWLISRDKLLGLGSFKAVSHNIIPEGYFARELIKSDGYSFIRADGQLDVRTVKPVEEQLATALRTRYPQLKKRPENVLLLLLLEISLLAAPLFFAVSALWNGFSVPSVISLLALLFLIVTHYAIMSASNPSHSILALVNLPFALATELIITLLSMLKYEFGSVMWKGRNVCIPAMHVVPKLPKT